MKPLFVLFAHLLKKWARWIHLRGQRRVAKEVAVCGLVGGVLNLLGLSWRSAMMAHGVSWLGGASSHAVSIFTVSAAERQELWGLLFRHAAALWMVPSLWVSLACWLVPVACWLTLAHRKREQRLMTVMASMVGLGVSLTAFTLNGPAWVVWASMAINLAGCAALGWRGKRWAGPFQRWLSQKRPTQRR